MADWLDEQLAAAPKPGAKGAAPSEGTSWLDEQLAAAPKAQKEAVAAEKPKVSAVDDAVQATGSGIAKGVLSRAGIAGDFNELLGLPAYGLGKAAEWAGLVPQGLTERTQQQYREAANKDAQNPTIMGRIEGAFSPPTSHQVIKGVENATGTEFYKPQTAAGRFADTAGTFVGAGANPMNAKSVAMTAAAGLSSEGAGEAAEKFGFNPAMQTVARAAGALAPAGVSKLVTPNAISPERKALVDTLDKEGVPLTAGQKTGNKTLEYAEASTVGVPGGGHGAEAITEAQQRAFTRAAMKRMGEPGQLATPEVFKAAGDRFEQTYNGLTSRNTLTIDQPMMQDLGKAVRDYHDLVGQSHQVPIVQNTVADVVSHVVQSGGKMTGSQYHDLRSRLGRAAANTNDTAVAAAIKGIRKAMDEAMGRSMPTADKALWDQTNREYRNWKAIQPAANGAGENAAQGMISPARLRSSVVQQNGNAYSQGRGDLGPLARAGTLINPLPNSGTAQRVTATGMMSGTGALLGSLGGAQGAVTGASVGAALGPVAFSRLLMSRPAQKYLGNQVLSPDAITAADKLRMMSGARLPPGLLN